MKHVTRSIPDPSAKVSHAHSTIVPLPWQRTHWHCNPILNMELTLESEISREVALENHDGTALTKDQQDRLNQNKVLLKVPATKNRVLLHITVHMIT